MKTLQQITFLALVALVAILAANVAPELVLLQQADGDAVRGGRIYDSWMLALDLQPPEGNHPLWDTQFSDPRQGLVTWQCSSCHGWDYKGAQGTFRPGSPNYTGFPGLGDMVGASESEVQAWLNGSRNPEHDFSEYFGFTAVQDLAAFLRTQQIDTDLIIDPQTGSAFGDEAHGAQLYDQACESCHGQTGRQIDFSNTSTPIYLGDVADTDPWRAVHKIRFGNSFGTMPASEDAGWSLSWVADVVAFLQTLPRGNPELPLAQGSPITSADIRNQGNMEPIVQMGLAILAIVLLPLAWDTYMRRKRSPSQE